MADALPDDDFDRLLVGHLDGTLDVADTGRLHARLRTDGDARRLLLAAATQASALPRLGLESSARALRPVTMRPRRWWWAAAAVLLLATGWWLSLVLVEKRETPTGVVVEHDGRPYVPVIDDGKVRSGVRPLIVRWLEEDTRIELAPFSRLRFEELGARKRLVLEAGALRASVAAQPADGGLQVTTPHGRIEVVGTSFTVEVQERVSHIVVMQGVVRVAPGEALATVPLSAGYEAKMTPTQVSAPGPVAEWPMPMPLATKPPGPLRTTRLTVGDFIGGEGELVNGEVRAVWAGGVRRLTTPIRRPDGYVSVVERLRVKVRVTVDQPTTLALLLVCDQPSGGARWVGNLQAERHIPAGTHELTFTRADLRPATDTVAPGGSRVVALAVMCWGLPADLRLEWIDLIH